jgi:ATP-dependent helicase/nuclease subunit B
MLRAVPSRLSAYHRAQVVSFQRLAYLILQEANLTANQALTEPARVMVLRHLVQRLRPQLQYYRRVERLRGLLDHLGRTISELIQESVEPDDLAVDKALTRAADAHNPREVAKLHDLRLLYAEYLAYLGTQRIDPSQHLDIARQHLGRCRWLNGALLWADGFASFSEQELSFFLDLVRLAEQTQITALLDPSAARALPTTAGLFRRTTETFQRLRRRLHEAGIRELDPLILNAPVLPRFATSSTLALLEKRVFQSELGPPPLISTLDGLQIVELPSPRVEVDYAVSRISGWVQDQRHRLRYRDTAIIVRDLDAYHDLLRNALTSRHVPFFIDKRRPLTHHPLVELVRAALRSAVENASPDSMRQLLKSDLLPISAWEADAVENHLLATGVSGFDAWERPWAPRSRQLIHDRAEFESSSDEREESPLNRARAMIWHKVEGWCRFARSGMPRPGPDWATAVRSLLSTLEAGTTMARWTTAAEELGEVETADEHRQAWAAVFSLLDDVAFAFEATPLSIEHFAEVLEASLASLTLGLVPPTVDQVLVGAIERSRHPNIKAAVLVGFNDGVFPKQPIEDSILNDDDRRLLRGRGVPLAPPTRERVTDEPLLAYIALTRASEQLVVTYSTTDSAGRAQQASPFVADLQAAVPGLRIETIGDPVPARASWDVLATVDLRRRLAEEFRDRAPASMDNQPLRARWNGIYARCRESLALDRATRAALAALDPAPDARLNPMSVRRLIPDTLETSVSQLETFATCPFKHFAKHVLRLRERDEAELNPLDVGQVHHAVLAEFTKRLIAQNRTLGELEDALLHKHLRESCLAISTRLDHPTVLPRDSYRMARTAQQLVRVIQAQRRRQPGANMRSRASELPFGFDATGLPALRIRTPAGRMVALRGYIDHVDLFELADETLGIIVDYKARRQVLDLSKAYHGVSLQLLAYLLALSDSGESLGGRPIRPAGALYVGIQPAYKLLDHPSLLSERDTEWTGAERPRGILLEDALNGLDESGQQWSRHFQVYRKTDGSFGRPDSTDAATSTGLSAMLGHTRRKLGALADAMLEGDVGVKPCRIGKYSPCSWCEMAAVCRFEMGLCEARFLEPMKRSDVFRRISDELDRSR